MRSTSQGGIHTQTQELILAFFLIAGIAMIAGFAAAGRLYSYNLDLYRKWGWTGLARIWVERRSWWLPTCRAICLTLGVVFLVIAAWALS
jgi:hypothetical protein